MPIYNLEQGFDVFWLGADKETDMRVVVQRSRAIINAWEWLDQDTLFSGEPLPNLKQLNFFILHTYALGKWKCSLHVYHIPFSNFDMIARKEIF